MLKVNEIFLSIQGEGNNIGYPTVFVRLQGCNLKPPCSYCDTLYAVGEKSKETRELTSQEVIDEIVKLSPWVNTRVCITGGEPLVQEGLADLVKLLNLYHYYIEVFTNGSLPKPLWWTRVDSWVVDIKCPSSKVWSTHLTEWLDCRASDQMKFTVGSEEDLTFADEIIRSCKEKGSSTIIVSPIIHTKKDITDLGKVIWDQDWLQRVVEFCTDHRARFSLQIHKVIWGDRRGV